MTDVIEPQFVDTNVLVYAYDVEAGEKYRLATRLLENIWRQKNGCVSVQVLQEFYVNITRKSKQSLSAENAKRAIHSFSVWKVFRHDVEDVLAAIDVQQRFQISFWDALVVRSAQRLGCKTLWSEDLSDGQDYDGVKVVNPFN